MLSFLRTLITSTVDTETDLVRYLPNDLTKYPVEYMLSLGDCTQDYIVLYSSLNGYQWPFQGTVRTLTVVSGRG